MHAYEEAIAASLDRIAGREIYFDAGEIMESPDEIASGIVAELIRWACEPTNIMPITIARERLCQFPREWAAQRIRQTAVQAINIADDWEYRRLLEVCELISRELLAWALTLSEGSEDPDVLEATEDFRERLREQHA